MNRMPGIAGNRGDAIRSDCYVSIELTKRSGVKIELESKVSSLYGESIQELGMDILRFYKIQHAKVCIEDKGALDFVLAARLEAAIQAVKPSDRHFLLPVIPGNRESNTEDIPLRSRLYLPGNSPKLMINAGLHRADGIILDLEDSVSPDKKEEARYLVRNALRSVNFYGAIRMVRINQLPVGFRDLGFLVPHPVEMILIPKCEFPEQLIEVEEEIKRLGGRVIPLMPIIESALGIENAYRIATATGSVVALAIGLEDYTADIGASRTEEGMESFYARSAIVNAATAAGIPAIDSVYSDVSDLEGLSRNVARSKAMGFKGMGCIHPRQIRVIHRGFDPTPDEIARAKEIVLAFEESEKKGFGVITVGSKMIDLPVVKRAVQTLDLAERSGLIPENWREDHHG